jgi:hypothetical protein
MNTIPFLTAGTLSYGWIIGNGLSSTQFWLSCSLHSLTGHGLPPWEA